MKRIVLAVLGVAFPGMALAQSATFEASGFPVSLHQAQVMAIPNLHEKAEAPMLFEHDGLAASPIQVLVLMPRRVMQQDDTVARKEIARNAAQKLG